MQQSRCPKCHGLCLPQNAANGKPVMACKCGYSYTTRPL